MADDSTLLWRFAIIWLAVGSFMKPGTSSVDLERRLQNEQKTGIIFLKFMECDGQLCYLNGLLLALVLVNCEWSCVLAFVEDDFCVDG